MDTRIILYKNYLTKNYPEVSAETIYFLDKIAYHKNLTSEEVRQAEEEVVDEAVKSFEKIANEYGYEQSLDTFNEKYKSIKALFGIAQHSNQDTRITQIKRANGVILGYFQHKGLNMVPISGSSVGLRSTEDKILFVYCQAALRKKKTTSTTVNYAGGTYSYEIFKGAKFKMGSYNITRINNKDWADVDIGNIYVSEDSIGFTSEQQNISFPLAKIDKLFMNDGGINIFVSGRSTPYTFRIPESRFYPFIASVHFLINEEKDKAFELFNWEENYITTEFNPLLEEYNRTSKQWLQSSMEDDSDVKELEKQYGIMGRPNNSNRKIPRAIDKSNYVNAAMFLGCLGVHKFLLRKYISGLIRVALTFSGLYYISIPWGIYDSYKARKMDADENGMIYFY